MFIEVYKLLCFKICFFCCLYFCFFLAFLNCWNMFAFMYSAPLCFLWSDSLNPKPYAWFFDIFSWKKNDSILPYNYDRFGERKDVNSHKYYFIISLVIVHCYSVCAPDAFHILSSLWFIVYQWFKSFIFNICYCVLLKRFALCVSARFNLCSAVKSMCFHCFAIVCCSFSVFQIECDCVVFCY